MMTYDEIKKLNVMTRILKWVPLDNYSLQTKVDRVLFKVISERMNKGTVLRLIEELEREGYLKVLLNEEDPPTKPYPDARISFELQPSFFTLHEELDRKYNEHQLKLQLGNSEVTSNKEIFQKLDGYAYRVIYNDLSGEILVNGFLLAKPDYDSENERVFDYLYDNPNKDITKDEIEQNINRKIKKSFHMILRDLGFEHDFYRVFFKASKNSIYFRNPVSFEHLKQLGIGNLRIKAFAPAVRKNTVEEAEDEANNRPA